MLADHRPDEHDHNAVATSGRGTRRAHTLDKTNAKAGDKTAEKTADKDAAPAETEAPAAEAASEKNGKVDAADGSAPADASQVAVESDIATLTSALNTAGEAAAAPNSEVSAASEILPATEKAAAATDEKSAAKPEGTERKETDAKGSEGKPEASDAVVTVNLTDAVPTPDGKDAVPVAAAAPDIAKDVPPDVQSGAVKKTSVPLVGGKSTALSKTAASLKDATRPADSEKAPSENDKPKDVEAAKAPAAAADKQAPAPKLHGEKTAADFAALVRDDSASLSPAQTAGANNSAQAAALLAPSLAGPAASAAQTMPAPLAAAVPLDGVAVAIATKAESGKNHFEIRLDPPELGRIEVRLEVDRSGAVTSHLIADRPDTLDALRRDAAGLERALQDAGLKTGDNGMQFSLRDQSAGSQTPAPAQTTHLLVEDEISAITDAAAHGYARAAAQRGGIDIRV